MSKKFIAKLKTDFDHSGPQSQSRAERWNSTRGKSKDWGNYLAKYDITEGRLGTSSIPDVDLAFVPEVPESFFNNKSDQINSSTFMNTVDKFNYGFETVRDFVTDATIGEAVRTGKRVWRDIHAMYTGNVDQKLAGLGDLSHAVLEAAANEVTFGAAGKVASYLAKYGKFKQVASEGGLALKQRVLGNIAESRASRESSNFAILAAKEDQLLGGYHVDRWTMTKLSKGEVACGGLPGQSNYYTNLETILASNSDKATLGKILQVNPHPEKGYRPNIGIYEVKKNIRIPEGLTLANPHLGVGGGKQYFINKELNYLKLKNEYNLERFYEFNMPRNKYGH